jgi:hypothetical protein
LVRLLRALRLCRPVGEVGGWLFQTRPGAVSAGLVPTLGAMVTALAQRKGASLSVEVLADYPGVVCWVWVLDLVAWSRGVPRGCRSVRSSVVSGVAGGALALGASTRLCLAQATLLVRDFVSLMISHIEDLRAVTADTTLFGDMCPPRLSKLAYTIYARDWVRSLGKR